MYAYNLLRLKQALRLMIKEQGRSEAHLIAIGDVDFE